MSSNFKQQIDDQLKMDETMPDDIFSNIVNRELFGKASQKEIDFLNSSKQIISRWRVELIKIQKETDDRLSKLTPELKRKLTIKNISKMGDIDFEKTQKEVNDARLILRLLKERFAQIKLWNKAYSSKSLEEFAVLQSSKSGYCEGWQEAIDHMSSLIQKGLPPNEAYLTCLSHYKKHLAPWAKSKKLWQYKPHLSYSVERALKNT